MPVNDGEHAARCQHIEDGAHEAGAVRDAVKDVGEKHEAGRFGCQFAYGGGIGRMKIAIGDALRAEALPRQTEHGRIEIDGEDMTRALCHRQCEPAIAGAEVDGIHTTGQTGGRKN